MSHQFRFDRFEQWLIADKARQLAGKVGFTQSDVEDIAQEIRLDVVERLSRFDPAKSNRHTFISMLVAKCVASIIERECAQKRNYGRRPHSLNAPIRDAEDREVELHQALGEDARRPGCSEEERRDLIVDVRRVVASLPDDLRTWCKVFASQGIREASREFDVPRCRLQRIKAKIREAFEQAGLADYLGET